MRASQSMTTCKDRGIPDGIGSACTTELPQDFRLSILARLRPAGARSEPMLAGANAATPVDVTPATP
jgi:hypothetical protein